MRILLLIKVMRICDHWPTDTPCLHFEPLRLILSIHGPLRLNFEPRELLSFGFNADPDTAFHYKADLDSASQKMRIHADPDPKS
jgi:hypothetical protein